MRLSQLLTYRRGRNLFLPAHGRGLSLPAEMKSLLSKRAGIWDLPELPDWGGPLLKNGYVAESQNKFAKELFSNKYKQRVIKPKKGKGSFSRKKTKV